jgi:hypothetical protein
MSQPLIFSTQSYAYLRDDFLRVVSVAGLLAENLKGGRQ